MVGELLKHLLRERPILGRLVGERYFSPLIRVPATGELLDRELETEKKKKMEEWAARGVPEPVRMYAISLAEHYVAGMAEFLYPGDAEAQKKFILEHFPKAVEKVSEPWIEGILRAMGML
ncbi:MAG: hypothetical protein QXL22_01165 [Candidatus Nezhaarchaeales archaeon]